MKELTIRFIIMSHFKESYNNKIHFKKLFVFFKPKLIHVFKTNKFQEKEIN
jgi:hypothetical protein